MVLSDRVGLRPQDAFIHLSAISAEQSLQHGETVLASLAKGQEVRTCNLMSGCRHGKASFLLYSSGHSHYRDYLNSREKDRLHEKQKNNKLAFSHFERKGFRESLFELV